VAIQRFFLGMSTGIANVGKYNFTPASRSYPSASGDQPKQDYNALVFGDVAASFVHRPDGQSQDATEGNEIPATVSTVTLPKMWADQSRSNFNSEVTTSMIDRRNYLVGFQGDLTFDEREVSFDEAPVENAGLTSRNWNVSGNVLPGPGPIRTLRISAYSTDFVPLAGEGTLFGLKMNRMPTAEGKTELTWAAAPNNFYFIDANLQMQRPGSATLK